MLSKASETNKAVKPYNHVKITNEINDKHLVANNILKR